MHQISSGATRKRKENLKTHILMYRLGGWTGGGDIYFPAHSIIVTSDIAFADYTMFPPPVQPPMLYTKMCVFKFSLRFRVAALEIWCTTFRKFEKTCFKSLLSLHWCLILYGSVDYKTTKSKLLFNVLGVIKKSFFINKIDDF